MASSGQLSEIPHLVALIKTLTNPGLKDLLRNEGLPVSGVKASLQLRIIDCSLSLWFSLSASPLPPRGYLYLFLGFLPSL
jgi:hypothetical protein